MRLYDYQSKIARMVREGLSVILQAPTGAGKTMASLWPFLEQWELKQAKVPKKCIYTVPMRVLANQFTYEYQDMVQRRLLLENPPSVCIQTGERPEDREFDADLTFATIDQVLSSWLMYPYSLSRRLGNLNAGALVGSYLVFDEFHLFDPDSTLPTTLHMLKTLKGISPFILMTATFSAEMLQELAKLLDAEAVLLKEHDLQGISSQNKMRQFYLREQPMVIEDMAKPEFVLETHKAQQVDHKRSVVILNQVERAQRFYEVLLKRIGSGTQVRLLHSRFLKENRKRIEDEIRREFGKEKGEYRYESLILVATQVIEVGLDITCHTLHTEIAPGSSVLQRAGRCARYQGETGEVFVCTVENYAPYSGREAKAQCKRTWDWLYENQGCHLDFGDEQALINHVHGPSDRGILDALQAGAFERSQQIQALWQGAGNRGDATRLVRNIQSQALVVHSDPDQLLQRPFSVESFSLHPGTIRGKFDHWQEAARENFVHDALPFAVCRLAEDLDDDSTQSNRPPTYHWVPVRSKHELTGAPLLVVHPSLVGHREDLGFTLYPGEYYEASVPVTEKREWEPWSYHKESYKEHVQLVYEAFFANEPLLNTAGRRLESRYGWPEGSVSAMAHLVVCLHDLGKLDQRWQGWALQWQKAIDLDHNDGYALAHTDYNGYDDQHRELDLKLHAKRPHHAVEGALAAVPFLAALIGHADHPLVRAGFSAIARHHAPQSWQSDGYQLIDQAPIEIEQTLAMLPGDVSQLVTDVIDNGSFQSKLAVDKEFIRNHLLLRADDTAEVCAYMLMVRALRRADREGTSKGTIRQEVG